MTKMLALGSDQWSTCGIQFIYTHVNICLIYFYLYFLYSSILMPEKYFDTFVYHCFTLKKIFSLIKEKIFSFNEV